MPRAKTTLVWQEAEFHLQNQFVVSSESKGSIEVEVGMPGRGSDISIWKGRQCHFAAGHPIKTPTQMLKTGEFPLKVRTLKVRERTMSF